MVIQVLGVEGLDLKHIADGLHWVFLLVPHYSLATAIFDSYYVFSINKICEETDNMVENTINEYLTKRNISMNYYQQKSVSCLIFKSCCGKSANMLVI